MEEGPGQAFSSDAAKRRDHARKEPASACPTGSQRNRNRKPGAGIYSNSSAPDHTVLSVVHLFWGQTLKSLLPESAPGRPASPLLSQESSGARESDPQAGPEVPPVWQTDRRRAQAQARDQTQAPYVASRGAPAGSAEEAVVGGAAPFHPPSPWVSLSFSSQGCLSLSSWLLGLLSFHFL